MTASVTQLKAFCRDKRIITAGYCEKRDFQDAVLRYIGNLRKELVANGVVEEKKPVAAAAAERKSNDSSDDDDTMPALVSKDSDSGSSTEDEFDMPQLSTAGGIDSKKNDTMKVSLDPILLLRFHAHHQVFLLFVPVIVYPACLFGFRC